jgi:hypothetical protein
MEIVNGDFNVLEEYECFMLRTGSFCACVPTLSEVLIEPICQIIASVSSPAQCTVGYDQFSCWCEPLWHLLPFMFT